MILTIYYYDFILDSVDETWHTLDSFGVFLSTTGLRAL